MYLTVGTLLSYSGALLRSHALVVIPVPGQHETLLVSLSPHLLRL